MTLHEFPDLDQRSDEWYAARCGIVTASTVGALINSGHPDPETVPCPSCEVPKGPCLSIAIKVPTPLKKPHNSRIAVASAQPPVLEVADNDSSRGLTAQLVAERITGVVDPTFISNDMWRGIEHEPYALEKYAENYAPVTPMGFMVWKERGWALGYSPDGLVGADGLVEVKCPRAKTQVRTILSGEVPAHHMAQLQAGLYVSGRKWIDFISFCAGMPLFVRRVHRSTAWFVAIVDAVEQFETTAAEMVAAYHEAAKDMPATERIDMEIY